MKIYIIGGSGSGETFLVEKLSQEFRFRHYIGLSQKSVAY